VATHNESLEGKGEFPERTGSTFVRGLGVVVVEGGSSCKDKEMKFVKEFPILVFSVVAGFAVERGTGGGGRGLRRVRKARACGHWWEGGG
jgi:hypothetical protein